MFRFGKIFYTISLKKLFFKPQRKKNAFLFRLLKEGWKNLALFPFLSLKKRKTVLNYSSYSFSATRGELVAKAKQGKCPGKWTFVIYDILGEHFELLLWRKLRFFRKMRFFFGRRRNHLRPFAVSWNGSFLHRFGSWLLWILLHRHIWPFPYCQHLWMQQLYSLTCCRVCPPALPPLLPPSAAAKSSFHFTQLCPPEGSALVRKGLSKMKKQKFRTQSTTEIRFVHPPKRTGSPLCFVIFQITGRIFN